MRCSQKGVNIAHWYAAIPKKLKKQTGRVTVQSSKKKKKETGKRGIVNIISGIG
jgi:hypothetical protein